MELRPEMELQPELQSPIELDEPGRQAENAAMRQALNLVLFISILLGLFGQTAAVAASPGVATAIGVMAPAAMPMDCLGMMQNNGENSLPCERMTLACVAGMGCLPLLALDSRSSPVPEAVIGDFPPAWPLFPALHGRSAQPEPHPPNILV